MPNELLEWNLENFTKVLADIYREIETDDALRQRLLSDAFSVLSERIAVSEEWRGGIFAREKGKKTLMLYPPAAGATRQALPEGTTEAQTQKDYDPICSSWPVW